MPQTSCGNCGKIVSPKAFDCPGCGHPLRKPRRGFFGVVFKYALIVFNVFMLWWLVQSINLTADQASQAQSDAQMAGTAVGATIGFGIILVIWALGDVILGLLTLLTRPSK